MKKIVVVILTIFALSFSACLKDLDQKPFIEVTSEKVYDDPNNYIKVLARLYSGLSVTGQKGPAGDADIASKDEGFNQYLRIYWYLQELPTDVATLAWGDEGVADMNKMTWTSTNPWVKNMYTRIFYQINICNEFIRECADDRLKSRGVESDLQSVIKAYRAEARYLRALSYYHALDLYANVPFVTEKDAIGALKPKQSNRTELFAYIESELLAIEPDLLAPKAVYGRADKAACWALLAKLYQNAEIYIGQKKDTEAINYCKKVISQGGFVLESDYDNLFLADNDKSKEIIFAIQCDGQVTRSWGSTTFLVNASVGGKDYLPDTLDITKFYGISGAGWYGYRPRKNFINLFNANDIAGKGDDRANFFTKGRDIEIDKVSGSFAQGYVMHKFRNVTSSGVKGSHPTHPDTDFPLFRLSDIYLTYAESILRGGTGGDKILALKYINDIRARAKTFAIADKDLTLDFILDERARELYWEAYRRQDLIRFGKFTGDKYLWTWKGDSKDGNSMPNHLNIYPIPAVDLVANPNLRQNPGY